MPLIWFWDPDHRGYNHPALTFLPSPPHTLASQPDWDHTREVISSYSRQFCQGCACGDLMFYARLCAVTVTALKQALPHQSRATTILHRVTADFPESGLPSYNPSSHLFNFLGCHYKPSMDVANGCSLPYQDWIRYEPFKLLHRNPF